MGRCNRVHGISATTALPEKADAAGVTRVTVDVAPVSHVKEDPSFPGRITLHVGKQLIYIDSRPTLSIEIVSAEV